MISSFCRFELSLCQGSSLPQAAPRSSRALQLPMNLPSSNLLTFISKNAPRLPLHPLPSGLLTDCQKSQQFSKQSRPCRAQGPVLPQSRYLTSFTLFRKPQESGKEAGYWQVCAYFFLLGTSINFLEVRQIMAVQISAPTTPRRQGWIEVGTGQTYILLLTPSPPSHRTFSHAGGR